MGGRYVPDSAVSFRLEEPLDVPYQVIGTKEWVRETIPDDFPRDQLLVVRSQADLRPCLDHLWKHVHSDKGRLLSVDSESSGPRELDGLDPVSPTSSLVLFQIGWWRSRVFIEGLGVESLKSTLKSRYGSTMSSMLTFVALTCPMFL